jgi:uncharacterized membrane protein
MQRLLRFLSFLFESFGPLATFLIVDRYFGLRAAIGASIAFALIEVVALAARKKQPTQLFVMTTLMTLAFGAVDLTLATPRFFRFEAVVTNVLTGLWFGATLRGDRSMLLEFYEKTKKPEDPSPPELPMYLRRLTQVWTISFFAKAALYLALALTLPLDRAIYVRSIVGPATFLILLLGERAARRPLFSWLKERGWLAATAR